MIPAARVEEIEALLAELAADDERMPEAITRDEEAVLCRVIESTRDPDPEVRLKACGFAGMWLKRREVLPEDELTGAASEAVARLMREDSQAKVRWTAVLFSEGLRPSPISHLLAAMRDRSCTVRYYIAFALSCYTAAWFQGAREQYRPLVREGLLRLTEDTDEQVREWATLGLVVGGHRDPAGSEEG